MLNLPGCPCPMNHIRSDVADKGCHPFFHLPPLPFPLPLPLDPPREDLQQPRQRPQARKGSRQRREANPALNRLGKPYRGPTGAHRGLVLPLPFSLLLPLILVEFELNLLCVHRRVNGRGRGAEGGKAGEGRGERHGRA